MSNLHIWKTKGIGTAGEYISHFVNKDEMSYSKMKKIQDDIGIKRC